MKKELFAPFLIAFLAVGLFSQCRMQKKNMLAEDALPPTPEYNDTTQWYALTVKGRQMCSTSYLRRRATIP